jgi:hypothetical protein
MTLRLPMLEPHAENPQECSVPSSLFLPGSGSKCLPERGRRDRAAPDRTAKASPALGTSLDGH